jgi:iron complex outermembrane recepter protein
MPAFRLGASALAIQSLVLMLTAVAHAQEPQRIEVTGSALKRIDAETTLPVTIVTREDIAKSGVTTAAELLDRLSANNGGGYNVALAIGDGARPGFAGASLRGLGSNTTLVLLNGRRLAVYAFDGGGVDLNSIALGAIERVEVLRDGASALYGSDAIAGVINFITKRDFVGLEVGATARIPQASGGKSTQGTVTLGWGDLAKDRFNVFGNFSYDKIDALKALQRSFAKTSFLPNAPGGAFDRTSGNTIPASVTTPAGVLNPGVGAGCLPPTSFQTAPTGPCRFDYAAVIDIVAPQEKLAGIVRGTFAITPDHEAYAEFNSTRTKSTFRISPTPASSATTFFGDPVLYPAGGPWYPKAINPATGQLENGILNHLDGTNSFVPLAGDLEIFWRTLDAGPRTNAPTARQNRLVLGTRGSLGGWDYDVGYMKSTSKVTESYTAGQLFESKLLNATCIDPVTSQPITPCGPLTPGYQVGTLNPLINPFGLNDAAGLAAIREALVLGPVRISKSERSGFDGKISGEVGKLAGGAVGAAFGGERRKETFDDQPLAVLGSGDIIGGGGNQAAVVGSRTVSAVFGEVVLPLVKGLELLAQVRHDKYSDFGSTTNPKLGLRWQPSPQWLLRASAGTGFRAPTLPDLLAQVTQTNTGDNYNDPFYEAKVGDCFDASGNPTPVNTPQYCNAQLTVKQGGNTSLKPEKSRQSTFGLVFQPTRDVAVGIDVWRIKVKEQIVTPDPDQRLANFIAQFLASPGAAYDPTTAKLTAAGKAALQANATGLGINIDPVTGYLDFVSSQLDNVSTIVTSGMDLSIKAVVARSAVGEFSAGLESSYIDSQKQDGVELVDTYSQFGPVVRWKHALSLDWKSGPWNAGVFYNHVAGYRDQGGTRDVGAWETVDVAVVYRGIKNLTLRAGVANLFDKKPPYSRQGDYFHVGYDPTIADPRGRTFTLGLNHRFF